MAQFVKKIARLFGKEKGRHLNGPERRRHARVRTPAWTNVCFLEGINELFGDGHVQDLSSSGLRFISDSRPDRGAHLKLKLHFPKQFGMREPLTLKAKVIRCSKIEGGPFYEVACAFIGIEDSHHKPLQTYIHWTSSGRR